MEQSQESSQACPITSMPNPGCIHPRSPSSVLLLGRRVSGSLGEQEWGSELSPVLSHSSVSLITCSAGPSFTHCQAMCLSTLSNNVSAFLKGLPFTGVPRHKRLRVTGLGTSVDSESERCLPMSVEALRATRLPSACSAQPSHNSVPLFWPIWHVYFLRVGMTGQLSCHGTNAPYINMLTTCEFHFLLLFTISSALCQSSFCFCCYYPPSACPNSTIQQTFH